MLLFLWLVEEDGGGVRGAAAALEAEMRVRFRAEATALTQTAFPRECIPFTAFYKTVLPFSQRVEQAGRAGRDDQVYPAADLVIGRAPSPLNLPISTGDVTFTKSKHLGHYDVMLRFRYEKIQVAIG